MGDDAPGVPRELPRFLGVELEAARVQQTAERESLSRNPEASLKLPQNAVGRSGAV